MQTNDLQSVSDLALLADSLQINKANRIGTESVLSGILQSHRGDDLGQRISQIIQNIKDCDWTDTEKKLNNRTAGR